MTRTRKMRMSGAQKTKPRAVFRAQGSRRGVAMEATMTGVVWGIRLSLPVGEYVKVTIADQGGGISEEVLPRIFDPYFTTK
jgi:signal transduction histidine kinase